MPAFSRPTGGGRELYLLVTLQVVVIKALLTDLTRYFCIDLGGMHLMSGFAVASPVLISFGLMVSAKEQMGDFERKDWKVT